MSVFLCKEKKRTNSSKQATQATDKQVDNTTICKKPVKAFQQRAASPQSKDATQRRGGSGDTALQRQRAAPLVKKTTSSLSKKETFSQQLPSSPSVHSPSLLRKRVHSSSSSKEKDLASRNWSFTVYDPATDGSDDPKHWIPSSMANTVMSQRESSPSSQRKHLQGVANFKYTTPFSRVKKLLPPSATTVNPEFDASKKESATNPRYLVNKDKVFWSVCRGSFKKNVAYCIKEHTRDPSFGPPSVEGTLPQQGKRSDMMLLKEYINENPNCTQSDVSENFFSLWIRYSNHIVNYMNSKCVKRHWKTEVTFCYGEPGTGKSRFCKMIASDYGTKPYFVKDGTKWFHNYNGQDNIVIDDFYGSITLNAFLTMLDRYPCEVESKGGYVNFAPKRIFITSNRWYLFWYAQSNSNMSLQAVRMRMQSLYRRFDNILIFLKEGKVAIYKGRVPTVEGFQLQYDDVLSYEEQDALLNPAAKLAKQGSVVSLFKEPLIDESINGGSLLNRFGVNESDEDPTFTEEIQSAMTGCENPVSTFDPFFMVAHPNFQKAQPVSLGSSFDDPLLDLESTKITDDGSSFYSSDGDTLDSLMHLSSPSHGVGRSPPQKSALQGASLLQQPPFASSSRPSLSISQTIDELLLGKRNDRANGSSYNNNNNTAVNHRPHKQQGYSGTTKENQNELEEYDDEFEYKGKPVKLSQKLSQGAMGTHTAPSAHARSQKAGNSSLTQPYTSASQARINQSHRMLDSFKRTKDRMAAQQQAASPPSSRLLQRSRLPARPRSSFLVDECDDFYSSQEEDYHDLEAWDEDSENDERLMKKGKVDNLEEEEELLLSDEEEGQNSVHSSDEDFINDESEEEEIRHRRPRKRDFLPAKNKYVGQKRKLGLYFFFQCTHRHTLWIHFFFSLKTTTIVFFLHFEKAHFSFFSNG